MYDVTQLFRSFDLLPSPEDSLSTKLNTITRLALIVCIVIAAYKPVLAFSTLIIVMVVTMSTYSSAVADPAIEGFEVTGGCGSNQQQQQLYEFMREYNSTRYPDLNKVGFPPTQKRFCNDTVPLEYGPDHVSPNQELVGGPNPKTRIPTLVAAPSHDLDSWRNNDFVVHSQINKETNFDAEKSGYNCGILPTKCEDCMYIPCQCRPDEQQFSKLPEVMIDPMVDLIEGFNGHIGARSFTHGSNAQGGAYGGKRVGHTRTVRDSRRGDGPDITNKPIGRSRRGRGGRGRGGRGKSVFLDRRLGDVGDLEIDEMTPKQEESESPDIASCFESPRRDNIITQTLQPGVFQKSHIGEPIQSNIGISYTQEWGPTEVEETDGMIKYTMRDPKSAIITPQIKKETIAQDHANVYDPRFTGYGTSYRAYTDQLTGRPKFFYDDVDAITMPNYITRSKIDVFPWADTYGPDKMSASEGGEEFRQMANNAFTDSAITFRTDLQERLMRKRNAELWQRRVAPISTMGRVGSSMRSCL